jgi:putative endonuclease
MSGKTNKVKKVPTNKLLGTFGELKVAEFLEAQSYEIIDRNWRIKEGEIDLVARDSLGILRIIEVKTRSSLAFGHPLEAINRDKARRLQRLALAWLATHHCLGSEFMIDVAAVLIASDGSHSIDYRENIL